MYLDSGLKISSMWNRFLGFYWIHQLFIYLIIHYYYIYLFIYYLFIYLLFIYLFIYFVYYHWLLWFIVLAFFWSSWGPMYHLAFCCHNFHNCTISQLIGFLKPKNLVIIKLHQHYNKWKKNLLCSFIHCL